MATTTMQKMTRTGLMFCCALLAVLPAMSQEATPPPAGGHADRRAQMQEMYSELNLTPDQQKVFKEAGKEQREKMKALRDNTSLSPQDKRQQMMQIHQDATAKMRAVLTDDQKPKFDDAQAKMRENMRHHMRGGGAPAGDGDMATPPPPPPPGA